MLSLPQYQNFTREKKKKKGMISGTEGRGAGSAGLMRPLLLPFQINQLIQLEKIEQAIVTHCSVIMSLEVTDSV